MVLLLNYLPWLVLFATAVTVILLMWKNKNKLAAAACVIGGCAVLILSAINPSYLPKGKPVVRNDAPAFEVKEAQLKNDLRELDEKVQADLEKKLDWEQKVEENKNDGT